MDRLGIECVVQYLDPETDKVVQDPSATGRRPITAVEFIRLYFEAVKR
jgi:hypothetical protein